MTSLPAFLAFFTRSRKAPAPHPRGIAPVRLGANPLWRALRRAVKAQVAVLQALRVETHPDKTFIGHAQKGFDFLGFHCCLTGVKVSAAALSRRDAKVARLYEQGASKQRIARYLVRWLGWAVAVGGFGPNAHAEVLVSMASRPCWAVSMDRWEFTNLAGLTISVSDIDANLLLVPSYGAMPFPCIVAVRGVSQTIASSSSPGGSSACSPTAPEYNQSTTCTATPEPGYTFSAWGDDCSTAGSASTCTLNNVRTAKTVSASFTAIPGYVPTGPVVDLVYDPTTPTTPTTLYSALDGGGVWKKVGEGSWTAATTQPSNLKVKALAIAASGATLYAGTDGGGVFKSTNSGVDWAACAAQPANLNLRSLALTGTTLYAGTTAGVFKSTDDCANWTAMGTIPP